MFFLRVEKIMIFSHTLEGAPQNSFNSRVYGQNWWNLLKSAQICWILLKSYEIWWKSSIDTILFAITIGLPPPPIVYLKKGAEGGGGGRYTPLKSSSALWGARKLLPLVLEGQSRLSIDRPTTGNRRSKDARNYKTVWRNDQE